MKKQINKMAVLCALLFIIFNGVCHAQEERYNIERTLSDQAQQKTITFDGLAFLTGCLGAQSFLPPGKVAWSHSTGCCVAIRETMNCCRTFWKSTKTNMGKHPLTFAPTVDFSAMTTRQRRILKGWKRSRSVNPDIVVKIANKLRKSSGLKNYNGSEPALKASYQAWCVASDSNDVCGKAGKPLTLTLG